MNEDFDMAWFYSSQKICIVLEILLPNPTALNFGFLQDIGIQWSHGIPQKDPQVDPMVYKLLVYGGFQSIGGSPKSSIYLGFSIVNHPFWGTRI